METPAVNTGVQDPAFIPTMRFLPIFFALLCCSLPGYTQNHYTDSLSHALKDPRTEPQSRILVLSQLARIVRFYDQPKALELAQKAIAMANEGKDALYKVYAYESRSCVYLKMGETESANKDMDSALLFSEKTRDILAKSWAWYQQGRSFDFQSKVKEALSAYLKALQYIKGKGHWKEEASIYYGLYGIFSQWEDLENEDKYALLALDAARKSGDPNNLCESWQAIASCAEERYDRTKKRLLLDSTMSANRNAITLYLEHEDYMQMNQLITIPCINLANAFNMHFPPSPRITDSVRHYAVMAFNYATRDKDTRLQAYALGLMQEDAKRNGDYDLAETYLMQALSLLATSANPDYYALSNVHRDLSELSERKKDYAGALEYHKAYLADYKKIYDMEQASSGKEMEARYQATEKEQQIKFLKESEALNRRLKYLYFGTAIALLAGLLFMFRAYHFRLRYAQQQEKLLQREKEEARLLAKLKEEEALLLESEKQKAELHAQLHEEQARLKAEESARLKAEQQVMLTQKELLQKEVMAGTLHVEQKNKVLQDLKNRLEEHPGKDIRPSELNKLINRQLHLDNDFEELKMDLKEIHPDFYKRLQTKSGNKLTTLDLKYCAYIYLKRSTKEMAGLLGVEPKSIRMSKYRIKQKLGLQKEDELDDYVREVV